MGDCLLSVGIGRRLSRRTHKVAFGELGGQRLGNDASDIGVEVFCKHGKSSNVYMG